VDTKLDVLLHLCNKVLTGGQVGNATERVERATKSIRSAWLKEVRVCEYVSVSVCVCVSGEEEGLWQLQPQPVVLPGISLQRREEANPQ
jgi:hypothetical protein